MNVDLSRNVFYRQVLLTKLVHATVPPVTWLSSLMMFCAARVLFLRFRARLSISSASFSWRLWWCCRTASSSAADWRSSRGRPLHQVETVLLIFLFLHEHLDPNKYKQKIIQTYININFTFCSAILFPICLLWGKEKNHFYKLHNYKPNLNFSLIKNIY